MTHKPRILVLMPAGERYGHDDVRWYRSKSRGRKDLELYHNTGDLFVHDSSLKLLDFDTVEGVEVTQPRPELIERYNAEFDYCFLRGSNYIHEDMEWERTLEVLEQLTIPVIPFGIGAQAPAAGPLTLSDETIRVMRVMADSCEQVGVRGSFTAQVLNDIGIRNSIVIGCPTAYRQTNPDLSIELAPLESVESVGYTLRREVGPRYTRDTATYLQMQYEQIIELQERFSLTLIAQGEVEEKQIFYRRDSAEQAVQTLIEQGWFAPPDDPLMSVYHNQMFYSDVVADYEDIVRQLDLVIGYRLHGNLMALANGTPAIYCSYDSRTREFADTYSIPSFDIESGETFRLEDYYQQELFDRFNARYRENYQAAVDFLEANGMAHRMPRASDAQAA